MLKELHLDTNLLQGTLPASWGDGGSFASLVNITLAGNNLSGPVPVGWGVDENGSSNFRALQAVTLRPGTPSHLVSLLPPLARVPCACTPSTCRAQACCMVAWLTAPVAPVAMPHCPYFCCVLCTGSLRMKADAPRLAQAILSGISVF